MLTGSPLKHSPLLAFRPTMTVLAVAAAFSGNNLALASQNEATLATVEIIGDKENLSRMAGAASIVSQQELDTSRPFTVNEVLRKVPGVNVRDEEGFGLRPNIAIRGLNPTRSTKITLLEDGLPLAYAPYGDNASYYHPMIDR